MNQYKSSANHKFQTINLPSSKSESNRLLILSALCEEDFEIHNLSEARDTQTLTRLLLQQQTNKTFDVLDAGTAMRFLTAYLAVSTHRPVILTGTERMQQRPIGTLVNALRLIGAEINYLKKEDYPPMEIKPFQVQKSGQITVPGNISSQYISALLMIAPTLPSGLKIDIQPPVYSIPYIEMTIQLMEKAGIKVERNGYALTIVPQKYNAIIHEVESDWSAASYWFSFIALSQLQSEISLKGLLKDSFQGDQAIVDIMKQLGVTTQFTHEGALVKKASKPLSNHLTLDFKKCPDLAQTVLTCCAALKVDLEITGLESLRIKETDRIAALQIELRKFNCDLIETNEAQWSLKSAGFQTKDKIEINTYEDHRMAMSFAPLALMTNLAIQDIEVVNKSYPGFWKDLESVGMQLSKK
ncbi:3-phosphoshikimate 1-carboxyvinyltransferase [Marivirga sp. S37H4]|uniref:3-phosphoshikimate 1-carboxyvinyltransferase n=1 Tax=Marivirga aurantiaca TaxID=2802615 RepID=A0A934WXX7_9BACT|nr:3-phosphoshikimate 1-carboxyvinyltransferase [Marivirga aurantiaca]